MVLAPYLHTQMAPWMAVLERSFFWRHLQVFLSLHPKLLWKDSVFYSNCPSCPHVLSAFLSCFQVLGPSFKVSVVSASSPRMECFPFSGDHGKFFLDIQEHEGWLGRANGLTFLSHSCWLVTNFLSSVSSGPRLMANGLSQCKCQTTAWCPLRKVGEILQMAGPLLGGGPIGGWLWVAPINHPMGKWPSQTLLLPDVFLTGQWPDHVRIMRSKSSLPIWGWKPFWSPSPNPDLTNRRESWESWLILLCSTLLCLLLCHKLLHRLCRINWH